MREYKKGGYAIIDLASTTIYKDALNAVASNKPVVVYDLPNVYFADTISVVSDDVVITKGGKTITINDANAVSSEGDISNHLYVYNFKYSKVKNNIFCDITSNKNIDFSTITKEKLSLLLGDVKHTASGVVDYGDAQISFVYAIYWNDDVFMLGSSPNFDSDTDTLKFGIDENFDENITIDVYSDIVITKKQLF